MNSMYHLHPFFGLVTSILSLICLLFVRCSCLFLFFDGCILLFMMLSDRLNLYAFLFSIVNGPISDLVRTASTYMICRICTRNSFYLYRIYHYYYL